MMRPSRTRSANTAAPPSKRAMSPACPFTMRGSSVRFGALRSEVRIVRSTRAFPPIGCSAARTTPPPSLRNTTSSSSSCASASRSPSSVARAKAATTRACSDRIRIEPRGALLHVATGAHRELAYRVGRAADDRCDLRQRDRERFVQDVDGTFRGRQRLEDREEREVDLLVERHAVGRIDAAVALGPPARRWSVPGARARCRTPAARGAISAGRARGS